MSADPQPAAGAASGPARADARRESGAFQRAILECVDYAIISTTPDGVIRTFNRAAERMLGYRAEEVIGRVTPEIIHDCDEVARRAAKLAEELGRPVPAGFEAFVAKTRLGLADEQEWTYIRKDGGRVPVQLSVTAMRDEAGEIIGFLGVAHDISRRREAQARVGQLAASLERRVRERTAELLATQQRYQILAMVAPVGIYHATADGQCAYVNERWCELTGRPAAAAQGDGWVAAVHPDDRAAVAAEWERAVRERRLFQMEYRYQRPGGGVRWVLGQAAAERNAAGEILGYVGAVTDITERRRVDAELRESEARFRGTFEQAAVGVSHVGLDGRWLRVNDWLCQLVGYAREELLGKTFQDITHPDDLAPDLENVRRLLAGELPHYAMDKRYFHRDGSVIWIRLTVSLVRGEDGAPQYFIAIIEDIRDRKSAEAGLRQSRAELEERVQERTAELARLNMLLHSEIEDRKAAEAELQNREEQLRDLFENATDLIQSVAPDGRILFVNRAWLNTLGYRMSELAALTIFDIIHPDCLGECQEHFARVMRGEDLNNFQAIFRTKGGRKIHVEGNASARFENGRPVATRGIFRDISKRKAVEAEREKLIAELQAALAEVKTLSGLLPVCGWCKKIRDDSGYWNSVEGYLKKSSGMDITHGICPDCQAKMMAELDKLTAESETPPPPSG
jgi:PAS domain S-box-containing protein